MRRLIAIGLLAATAAYAAGAKTYPSPEEAVQALIAAVRAGDADAILAVLGSDAKQIVRSGDAATDKQARERFVRAYAEANKIAKPNDKLALLLVGKDEWILPIPIVKDGAGWHFDVAEGQEEILNRRVGRNELHAIEAVRAYVDAQREYYLRNPKNDKLLQYAQKFASARGGRDGLYFTVKPGERPSPLGPLFDRMQASKGDAGKRVPYHGYYLAQGRMIGGFALVAWPAAYGNTGVMSFMVNQDGVVYQKDLGKSTAAAAAKITVFNPDKSWKPL
jgi:hypothetical protein